MELNEQQRDALEHARGVLAEDPRPHQGPLTAQWHTAVRLALLDVIKAFREEGDQDGDPAPGFYGTPWDHLSSGGGS